MGRRCCCCIELRTASILVGLLFLLADLAILVWASLGLAGEINAWPSGVWYVFPGSVLRTALMVFIGVSAVSAAADVALLAGAGRQQRSGLLLWLGWTGARLLLLTLGLLALLAVALWLQFDAEAVETLGWRRRNWWKMMDSVRLSDEQRSWARQHEFVVLAVLAAAGLMVMSVLWGWFAAVDGYSRRLKHASVIVHRSRTHTSHL